MAAPDSVDIVVYGATGFTGREVCSYLKSGSDGVSWAIAGRNQQKLEDLAKEFGLSVPIMVADVTRASSLDAMCARAKVVISCAGPFIRTGIPVVDACVRNGVHYVDTTGEFQFVRLLIEKHHKAAVNKKVAIVPCCAFDSVPSDMGNYLVHQVLKGSDVTEVNAYYKVPNTSPSAGTVHSIMELMATASTKDISPTSLNPAEGPKPIAAPTRKGFWYDGQRFSAPFLMAATNERIARRTNALLGYTSSYSEAMEGSFLGMAGVTLGIYTMGAGLLLPPVRWWIKRRWTSGSGPSKEEKEQGWFKCTFVGKARDNTSCTVVLNDPRDAYTMTGVYVAEAAKVALELASKNKLNGGVLTPMSAFGDDLVARLEEKGTKITKTVSTNSQADKKTQ